jgi:hypothetical protein
MRTAFHGWLFVAVLQAVTLTPDQRAAVERGEPVQVLENVASSPWPRARVYQFIDATPEESAAVLSDYGHQAEYSPQVKSARVVRRPGRAEAVVHYVIDIPWYPDEESEIWHRISCRGDEFDIEWQDAPDAPAPKSQTQGSARFLPWMNERTGKAGTLMVYEQLVVPSARFASVGFVKRRAIQTSRDAAKAIATRAEAQRVKNPALLGAERDTLRAALGAGARASGAAACH